MFISCIIPMYNESGNTRPAVERTNGVLAQYGDYEIICVNDGSADGTLSELEALRSEFSALVVESYPKNKGMGYAIKQGIATSKGDIVVTLDADLTFDPADIPKLLEKMPEYDLVIGSPYVKGGRMEGVPFHRKMISKLGNLVLSWAMPASVKSTTTVFRAYNRDLLDAIDIESDHMEINPEILAKASALGYAITEVPVNLGTREIGESKFNFRSGATGHFWLSAHEKPFLIFGGIGIVFLIVGLAAGGYIFCLYFKGQLDPTRPLINLTVLFIISGIIVLLFGFVSNQVLQVRRELLRLRKDMRKMERRR